MPGLTQSFASGSFKMSKSKKPKPPIFTSEYWARPQPRDHGDPNRTLIYQAVGSALNSWERLEEAIFYLCTVLSDTRDARAHHAIAEIFGSIESSGGRRNALERLSLIYFYPHHEDSRIKKPLRDLLDTVSNASRRRDDIAHGVTTEFMSIQAGGVDHGSKGCFLVPAVYISSRNIPRLHYFDKAIEYTPEGPSDFPILLRGVYRYTSDDIKVFEEKFRELMMKVLEFCGQLIKVDGVIPALRDKPDKSDP
jgi:hypothetical protein